VRWRIGRLIDARRYSIVVVLVFAVLASGAAVPDFLTRENVTNVITQSTALGILAIGQTFVILSGRIDLTVGQLLGLIVVLTCDVAAGRSDGGGTYVKSTGTRFSRPFCVCSLGLHLFEHHHVSSRSSRDQPMAQ